MRRGETEHIKEYHPDSLWRTLQLSKRTSFRLIMLHRMARLIEASESKQVYQELRLSLSPSCASR